MVHLKNTLSTFFSPFKTRIILADEVHKLDLAKNILLLLLSVVALLVVLRQVTRGHGHFVRLVTLPFLTLFMTPQEDSTFIYREATIDGV